MQIAICPKPVEVEKTFVQPVEVRGETLELQSLHIMLMGAPTAAIRWRWLDHDGAEVLSGVRRLSAKELSAMLAAVGLSLDALLAGIGAAAKADAEA